MSNTSGSHHRALLVSLVPDDASVETDQDTGSALYL
jgi:hypothetical protein